MEAAHDIYYQTDHYKGWPAVLIRLEAISDEELRHRIETAWRTQAGKKLLKELDGIRLVSCLTALGDKRADGPER